jgi:hypothetical protein
MTIPVINAVINFSTGPAFAQAMILDTGILDTNVLADAAAVIVDVSNVVNSIQTKRGRNPQTSEFQTGTLKLVIVDQNGDFNPQNAAGPYFNLLTPMRKVQITATYGGITYPVFSGFITSYSTSIPKAGTSEVALTTINAVDAFRLAQNAQISTVAGTSAGQLTGARINNILDQIAWPNSMRDVDQGLTTVQIDPGTARTSLQACQTVATTEFGAFYVDATGSFVFQDRQLTATSVAGTPIVFSDDGAGIEYFNAVWVLNDLLIFNSAQVTATGLATQTATNAASVAKYFLHSYNQQDLLMQDTATALNYAQAFVASNAETTVRCDAIELDLYTDNYNTGIIAALDLDYFDPVTIKTAQPGSTSIEKTLQVFGKAMNITPNSWKVTMTTLEAIIDGLILDSALYGLLDTDVLSY